MKMDKEFVTKHKFWLLLGAGTLFMFIAIFVLFVIVPRATAKVRAAVEKDWKLFQKIGDVKNEKFVDKAKKEADIEDKKKVEVWEGAADKQRPLFTWPKAVEDAFELANGNRATEIVIQAKDAKLADLPEDDLQLLSGTHKFHGRLIDRSADWIKVVGRPRKGSKDTRPLTKKFYRTPKVKILTPEEKDKGISFPDLQLHLNSLVAVTYDRGIYSYDDLTDNEQEKFRTSYKTQILGVLREAGPLNELDDVVVQFKDWPWRKGTKPPPKETPFFRWVETWNTELAGGGTLDLSEEAWLAQEDLWIYRELFRLVKKANDYVADFEPVRPPAKGKGDLSKFEGENPYWKLSASLVGGGKIKLRLTNKLERLQGLGVRFTVQLSKNGPYVLLPPINSVSLLPAGTKKTWMEEDDDTKRTVTDPSLTRDTYQGEFDLPSAAQGIYGVRQVLTWDTAAVRRIDQINIGTGGGNEWAVSHRLAHKPLVPFRKGDTPTVDLKAEDTKQPSGPRRGFGPAAAAQAVTRTLNGLARDRYLEKTDQARRVPVEIALIVDQGQVGRVQAAFANSPLRFLTTQLTAQRYTGSLRPQDEPPLVAEGKGGVAPIPSGPSRPMYYQGPGRPMSGRFGERFPGAGARTPAAGGSAPAASGGDEQESNLELVLYGVVSIYERFPPRRADGQAK